MTWWPGWNTAEGANTWAHIWFWFGMWCFLWLGISEIVAFMYGLRKDDLVAVAERTAADQAEQTQSTLQDQLAEAERRVEGLQKQNTPRRLTPEQKATLAAALIPFAAGQKVTLTCPNTVPDCINFAGDLIDALKQAKWDVNDNIGVIMPINGYDPVGIQFLVNPAWAPPDPRSAPAALLALGDALLKIGFVPTRLVRHDDVATGTIGIIIGRIPPTL